MPPFRPAALLFLVVGSLGAQNGPKPPSDARVVTVAQDLIAARRGDIGRSCATSDYTMIFVDDSITARGQMNATAAYLPFRVVSHGLLACRMFDSFAGYAFRYQSDIRLKANDFNEWQSTKAEVENRNSTPLSADDTRKALTSATSIFLRNLVTAEEEYFSNHSHYTPRVAELSIRAPTGIPLEIAVVQKGDGWSATADVSLLGQTCGIAINATNPVNTNATEGLPVCK